MCLLNIFTWRVNVFVLPSEGHYGYSLIFFYLKNIYMYVKYIHLYNLNIEYICILCCVIIFEQYSDCKKWLLRKKAQTCLHF